jgi:hypothetical protein
VCKSKVQSAKGEVDGLDLAIGLLEKYSETKMVRDLVLDLGEAARSTALENIIKDLQEKKRPQDQDLLRAYQHVQMKSEIEDKNKIRISLRRIHLTVDVAARLDLWDSQAQNEDGNKRTEIYMRNVRLQYPEDRIDNLVKRRQRQNKKQRRSLRKW